MQVTKSEVEITLETVRTLHVKLDALFPESLRKSQLFVDLADIHEICRNYLDVIDGILAEEPIGQEKLEDLLYKIDCQLFEHLPFHLKSLKKLLPKAISALNDDSKT